MTLHKFNTKPLTIIGELDSEGRPPLIKVTNCSFLHCYGKTISLKNLMIQRLGDEYSYCTFFCAHADRVELSNCTFDGGHSEKSWTVVIRQSKETIIENCTIHNAKSAFWYCNQHQEDVPEVDAAEEFKLTMLKNTIFNCWHPIEVNPPPQKKNK